MVRDLRTFLDVYEEEHPEQVMHIEKEVSADQEITALAFALEKEERYPVLVFHNVVTADGRKSKHPVVTNLFASRERCAAVLGSAVQDVGRDYYQKRLHKIKPAVVSREQAPVKEVVVTGDRIDLKAYPALVHHYMDPGPYFTSAYLTTYDPDTGIDNTATQRGWIIDKDLVRVYISEYTHNRANLDKYDRQGKGMPVAYWMGHHPTACLAGQVRLGYPESHFEAMGGLLGEPLRLVPSETLGDDFLVPADAEFVVEGIMEPGARYPEGPFGEYSAYIGPQVPNPQFRVTAITHRSDAYWHALLVGHPDNMVMGGFAIEGAIYETVKHVVPSLKNVYLPLSGTCRFHAYLQLENARPGDAREAIMTALAADFRIKHVFVFDEDIDIFNEKEVLWALATRTQWNEDVMIFPKVRGSVIDPTVPLTLTAKGGIDCTKLAGEAFSEKIAVSQEVAKRVRLKDYFSEEDLRKMPREKQ